MVIRWGLREQFEGARRSSFFLLRCLSMELPIDYVEEKLGTFAAWAHQHKHPLLAEIADFAVKQASENINHGRPSSAGFQEAMETMMLRGDESKLRSECVTVIRLGDPAYQRIEGEDMWDCLMRAFSVIIKRVSQEKPLPNPPHPDSPWALSEKKIPRIGEVVPLVKHSLIEEGPFEGCRCPRCEKLRQQGSQS